MSKAAEDRAFTFTARDAASGLCLTLSVEFSPVALLPQGSSDAVDIAACGTRLTGRHLGSEMPLLLDQALERGLASLYRESAEVLISLEGSVRS